jgi:hypothetical protein
MECAARLGITAERVRVEYVRIAFRYPTGLGLGRGIAPKSPSDLGNAEAAAICEIASGTRPVSAAQYSLG